MGRVRTLDRAVRWGKFIPALTLPVVVFWPMAIRPCSRWWRGCGAVRYRRRAQGRLRAGAEDARFCNAPNFAVEFFFFSLLAKIRALPFPFLFSLAKP
jgi:hypothetical protein